MLKTKATPIAMGLLIALSLSSYVYFVRYSPKVLQRLEEVKGTSSGDITSVPLPADAENVSNSTTFKWKQITFTTQKTPPEVQQFYRTIFEDRGWKLLSQTSTAESDVAKYKTQKNYAKVISSTQSGSKGTVASIEFQTR